MAGLITISIDPIDKMLLTAKVVPYNLLLMSASVSFQLEPDAAVTTLVGIRPGGALQPTARHLFNTRRLVGWAMQVARYGKQKYLHFS